MENIKRAAREQFMPKEAPYHKPTPLVSSKSERISPECGQQLIKYPSIYILFLIPLEQKEAAAANN